MLTHRYISHGSRALSNVHILDLCMLRMRLISATEHRAEEWFATGIRPIGVRSLNFSGCILHNTVTYTTPFPKW